MVRREVIAPKIARAAAWLNDSEVILSKPYDPSTSDVRELDLASFYLLLAIQECIDLAAHWVADEGWPTPDHAAGAFDVLAQKEAISRELATSLRAAAGLRNRIAHGYAGVDHARLCIESKEGIPRLREFLVIANLAAH